MEPESNGTNVLSSGDRVLQTGREDTDMAAAREERRRRQVDAGVKRW